MSARLKLLLDDHHARIGLDQLTAALSGFLEARDAVAKAIDGLIGDREAKAKLLGLDGDARATGRADEVVFALQLSERGRNLIAALRAGQVHLRLVERAVQLLSSPVAAEPAGDGESAGGANLPPTSAGPIVGVEPSEALDARVDRVAVSTGPTGAEDPEARRAAKWQALRAQMARSNAIHDETLRLIYQLGRHVRGDRVIGPVEGAQGDLPDLMQPMQGVGAVGGDEGQGGDQNPLDRVQASGLDPAGVDQLGEPSVEVRQCILDLLGRAARLVASLQHPHSSVVSQPGVNAESGSGREPGPDGARP